MSKYLFEIMSQRAVWQHENGSDGTLFDDI